MNVCAALKTSPNALLDDVDGRDEGASDLNWLLSALSNLSARERDTALEILRAYLRGV